MTYDFSPVVSQMIAQQLATGAYQSVDELVGIALNALAASASSDTEYKQTVQAIREGLADADAGRMVSLEQLLKT